MSAPWAALVACFLLAGCRLHFDEVDDAPADGPGGSGDADGSDGGGGQLRVHISGWGAVTGPGGIACADDCTYAISDPVTLGVVAGETWAFDHFDAPCGTQPTCTAAPDTTITATFVRLPITANRAFVTSLDSPLTGRASLDTFCAQRVTAGGLAAGTFIAVVSTTAQDAVARLAGSRGWVRLDGLPVIDQPSDFGQITLPRGVELDEFLGSQAGKFVQTGSTRTGHLSTGEACNDWVGSASQAAGAEADYGATELVGGTISSCGGRVYCFETGKNVPVSLTPPAFPVGRYVFLGQLDGTSGIAGADTACQTAATGAGLPGTYKALLATTTQSALAHTGSLAGAWRRPDGASVTRTGLDSNVLSTTFSMTANRTLTVVPPAFGATSLTQVATTGSCGDYTVTTGFTEIVVSAYAGSPFKPANAIGMCGARPMVCVQTP